MDGSMSTRPDCASPTAPLLLPLLLLLFVGSGCAALIYEIVWFQLLEFIIGGTAISIGVLLGAFMGGMCIGSLLLPQVVPERFHPLRVYACLEALIGGMALLLLWGMPVLHRLYVPFATPGESGVWLRALLAGVCLLPPTILMGATLPAIARWVRSTPKGVAWLGFFYGGNTAGAVIGALLAGYYLLRLCDMSTATYVAVSINGLVAVAAMLLSRALPHAGPQDGVSQAAPLSDAGASSVYVVAALSGASALGAEVVWTRLLSLLLGGTVYTFSLILAVFLFGLGVGSMSGAAVARRLAVHPSRPRVALAWCQVLCSLSIAWTAFAITTALPAWTIQASRLTDLHYTFRVDLLRCLFAVLPATLFWGASFPLALAAIAPGRDPARAVGRLYAANTLGAILGALALSLWLIPAIGTQLSQRVLLGLPALSAVILLLPRCMQESTRLRRVPAMGAVLLALAAPTLALFVLDAGQYDALPWRLACFGRYVPLDDPRYRAYAAAPLYVGEGLNSTVALVDLGHGHRQFHVSGRVEASSLPGEMHLQGMLGHFPALFHKDPKSVLIVGCGAGVTAGSFLRYPSVERITICEIEPLIPAKIAPAFGPENDYVVTRGKDGKFRDPRVHLVLDDARHLILTSREKFDIITSDPIHPWVKGSASLYTREYFELVKSRLKPGGLVTQWIPLYESSEETVKSEIATFCEVFPNATLWASDWGGGGWEMIILGSNEDYTIDESSIHERLRNPAILQSLARAGFASRFDILRTYAGNAGTLAPWLRDAQINRDRNLRLQYLAGASLNADRPLEIRESIAAHFHFPEDLFVVSDATRSRLAATWRSQPAPR
jgi:spermidine synthase